MTLRVLAGGRGRSGARPGLLVTGAAEITTFAGGVRRGAAQDEAAALTGGRPELAVFDGRIVAVGTHDDVQRRLAAEGLTDERRFTTLDARGGTVTPGLIDPHTHLLFAGTREAELRLRQRGAGYLEVLAAGGGILATVARTREASEEELADHGRHWLDQMLAHGVTTVEAKSGYGLDRATELRLLEVAARLGAEGPVEVVPTFLGAHAVPAEFRDRPEPAEAYLRSVMRDQLPAVAAQGRARVLRRLLRGRRLHRGPVATTARGGPAAGAGAAPPCRRAGAVGRRRAGGRAWRGLRRPPGRALAGRRRGPGPGGGR